MMKKMTSQQIEFGIHNERLCVLDDNGGPLMYLYGAEYGTEDVVENLMEVDKTSLGRLIAVLLEGKESYPVAQPLESMSFV